MVFSQRLLKIVSLETNEVDSNDQQEALVSFEYDGKSYFAVCSKEKGDEWINKGILHNADDCPCFIQSSIVCELFDESSRRIIMREIKVKYNLKFIFPTSKKLQPDNLAQWIVNLLEGN